jgi:hypothetical protein
LQAAKYFNLTVIVILSYGRNFGSRRVGYCSLLNPATSKALKYNKSAMRCPILSDVQDYFFIVVNNSADMGNQPEQKNPILLIVSISIKYFGSLSAQKSENLIRLKKAFFA